MGPIRSGIGETAPGAVDLQTRARPSGAVSRNRDPVVSDPAAVQMVCSASLVPNPPRSVPGADVMEHPAISGGVLDHLTDRLSECPCGTPRPKAAVSLRFIARSTAGRSQRPRVGIGAVALACRWIARAPEQEGRYPRHGMNRASVVRNESEHSPAMFDSETTRGHPPFDGSCLFRSLAQPQVTGLHRICQHFLHAP